MDIKVILSIAAALISALASLLVAWFNLRATRRLESIKRSYDLISLDINKLDAIHDKIFDFNLPSENLITRILKKPEDEQISELQKVWDELYKVYNKVTSIFLRNKTLFDEDLFNKITELEKEASCEKRIIHSIVAMHKAITGYVHILDDQILRKRNKIKQS